MGIFPADVPIIFLLGSNSSLPMGKKIVVLSIASAPLRHLLGRGVFELVARWASDSVAYQHPMDHVAC